MILEEVMEAYGFQNLPRFIGTPFQKEVDTKNILYDTIERFNGIRPIFVSHNMVKNDLTLYEQMVFDIDTDSPNSTLQMALDDTRKVANYFKKYDQLITFSGSGFHFYLKFTPRTVPITSSFKFNIRTFQTKIIQKLDLRTANIKVAEPRRVIRVPLTKYVVLEGDRYVVSNRYAIPLDLDTLNDSTLEEIMEMSKLGDPTHLPQLHGDLYPIDELLTTADEEKVITQIYGSEVYFPFLDLSDQKFEKWLNFIFDWKFREIVTSVHPDHNTRVSALSKVLHLTIRGKMLDLKSVEEFFIKLAEYSKWDNRDDMKIKYYVQYMYNSVRQ